MAETPKIYYTIQFRYLLLHAMIMLAASTLPLQRSESLFGMWGVPSLWGIFMLFVLPILSPMVLAWIVWRKLPSQKVANIVIFLVVSIFLSAALVIGFT
jgi:asparagine N-glycosylation enzyme membrane subunit Stt3